MATFLNAAVLGFSNDRYIPRQAAGTTPLPVRIEPPNAQFESVYDPLVSRVGKGSTGLLGTNSLTGALQPQQTTSSYVHGVSLADVIQMLQLERKPVCWRSPPARCSVR
jgi:hypothetical protein